MLCGSRRKHLGCLCPDHQPGWTGGHEGQRPDERKCQEEAQDEEKHDEIRRRHGEGWNEERYQVNTGSGDNGIAALPPGSAAFVRLSLLQPLNEPATWVERLPAERCGLQDEPAR